MPWKSLVVVAMLAGVQPALGQQIHRNAFEAGKTGWVKGSFDAPFDETAHAITDQVWHDGQRSEYINLLAKPGNFIHYQYSIGRAPVGEELAGSLWFRSNRPGAQLLARVILPNERDPSNLDNRLSTTIRGDSYRNAGRWQRLELGRVVQLAKQQQQLMQAQLQRPVNFEGAYIDSLLLNVYAGPGPTEVWIDDLEIGPVFANVAPSQPSLLSGAPGVPVAKAGVTPKAGSRNLLVEFNGNQLQVGGKRFFFHGIRLSDTPLRALRDAGFNAVFVDQTATPAILQEASDLGFWIVPQLRILADEVQLTSAESVTKDMARFSDNEAVLFWYLNATLGNEQTVPINRTVQAMRDADGRPVAADVWDGLAPYSRFVNMVGLHRWPLMTTLELSRYRQWLEQRRTIANPGTFTWTWIQTHMPEWFTQVLYERSANANFTEPVGPQPEQIRLLTYTALAAGCKGLGFWSDRFLADSHQGRDRLLCCAMLNQELEMLESLLSTLDGDPQWIDTSSPDVKAAVLRTAKGVIVMPVWQGKGAQFVPGQAAVAKLSITVPQIPQSMQAWEVTPADVLSRKPERVPGGTKITLPEFGLTGVVVFTSDTNVIVQLQEQARRRRQVAAQYTHDMALYELEKVMKVEEKLESQGHTLPDAQHLIADAQNRLKNAKALWERREFAESYHEAERSLRPLRILMRAQWDKAVKQLDSPVGSPYAVTFYSLPKHWQFMDEIKKATPAANALPGGDFEIIPERTQDSWNLEEKTLDEVDFLAQRVTEVKIPASAKSAATTEKPHEGKQCAMLQVKAKKFPVPFALEKTFLALTSPAVRLQPGSLVQISGWIRIPEPITGSLDGALFYDSAGGEPLGIRLTEPTSWKRFTLYRRVPASGTINVTLALTGLGTVYFDDVRVEPLSYGGGGAIQVQGIR